MTPIIRSTQQCGKCAHHTTVPGEELLECRAHPPSVSAFLVPGPSGPVINSTTSFPRMRPEQWCSEFRPHVVT